QGESDPRPRWSSARADPTTARPRADRAGPNGYLSLAVYRHIYLSLDIESRTVLPPAADPAPRPRRAPTASRTRRPRQRWGWKPPASGRASGHHDDAPLRLLALGLARQPRRGHRVVHDLALERVHRAQTYGLAGGAYLLHR